MSETEKPKQSNTVQLCTLVFTVAGIVGFQTLAPLYFPPTPGTINVARLATGAAIGAGCALLGALLGRLVERLRQ